MFLQPDDDPDYRAAVAAAKADNPAIKRLRQKIEEYKARERARCAASQHLATVAWVEGRKQLKESASWARKGRASFRRAQRLNKKSRFRKGPARTLEKRIRAIERTIDTREEDHWWRRRRYAGKRKDKTQVENGTTI
jgi:hypothetical protein